ncbi:TonB-dependent receptor plug domain-containing protein, partial [Verrucomicrobiota bacterium]
MTVTQRIYCMSLVAVLACAAACAADEEPVHDLSDMVVTAEQDGHDVFEFPTIEPRSLATAVSIVDTNDIKLRNAWTLTDALDYTPGALTETRGRKVKQFTSFRGQRYPYPAYALNGIWQREFHELPYFYPASHIERIEVVRSSAALLAGLSDLAGVVNVVPKRFRTETLYGEFEYGRFETYRGSLFASGPMPGGGYTIGAGYAATEGPSGRHAREEMASVLGTADWLHSDALRLQANFFCLDGSRQLARAQEPAARRFQTTEEEFDPFSACHFSVRGLYRESDAASTEATLFVTERSHEFHAGSGDSHTITDEEDHEYGLQLIQALGLGDDNVLRFGPLYNHWVAPDGKRFYAGRRTDLHTISGVVVDEQDFGNLRMAAGLRYTRTYIEDYGAFNIDGSGTAFRSVDPIQDEWDEPVLKGNVGAEYAVSDEVSLNVNVLAGFVEPRSGSLDVDLEEPENERRTMVDAGIRCESPRLGRVVLTGFGVKRDDAILLSGDTETAADGRELELYENQDLVQYGVELEARTARLMEFASLFANSTVMDSRARADGDYESYPDLPDVIVSAGVHCLAAGADCSLFGKHVGPYESRRFAADGEYHPLGDYVTLNLTAGYSFGTGGGTRIYGAVENLTDEEFSTVVGYPDYGRRA